MKNSPHLFDVVAGAPPEEASIIFIPTDGNATPGELNKYVVDRLGADYPINTQPLVSEGFFIEKLPSGQILVWIVTVGSPEGTVSQLGRNLERALPKALRMVDLFELDIKIWLPLMGTGVGGISDLQSADKTFSVFRDLLSVGDYPQLHVTVALPDEATSNSIERIERLAQSKEFKNFWIDGRDSKLSSRPKVAKGFGLNFQRETTEELALDRGKFALALARLFKIANGEFSLALLGKWGSGKTTIADQVVKYLRSQEAYNSDFNEVFDQEPETGNSPKYEIVEFNAWRYRRKPELWIWLYESFLSTFLNCSLINRVLRSIRAGTEKYGFFLTIISVALLAITAVPLMWVSLLFPLGIAVFGVTGLLGIFFLMRRWQGSLRLLVDRYGLIASHREKLGMQALIGEDLKSLVKAWSHNHQFSSIQKCVFAGVVVSIAVIWGILLFGENRGMVPTWFQSILLPLGFNESITSSINLTFTASTVAWIVWCTIAGAFTLAIGTNIGRTDRILLVVDDLDRCPQEEIVELIDGIKLMIDDEQVGKFVQVLVLADDAILEAAIRHRYERAEIMGREGGGHRWRTAVREHMEKVFLCHISIPDLEANDLEPLVDVFGDEFDSKTKVGVSLKDLANVKYANTAFERASNIIASTAEITKEILSSGAIEQSQIISETNFDPFGASNPKDQKKDLATVLATSELNAIKIALNGRFSVSETKNIITPRSIRSLLFKYQLARMLLQANKINFSTEDLASMLVQEVFSSNQKDKLSLEKSNEIAWVVRLVA
ncbi:MAG: P-loop NTPase fold protein [Hyphomicrobiales bacterium]